MVDGVHAVGGFDCASLVPDREMLRRGFGGSLEMTAADAKRVSALTWENDHTRRFRKLTGRDDLCCAFDRTAGSSSAVGRKGRWMFAVYRDRTIVTDSGKVGARDVQRVPVVWWTVEDDRFDPPRYVDIMDPRLPGMLLEADLNRSERANLKARMAAKAKQKAQQKAAWKRDIRDRTKELWPAWQRVLHDLGVQKPHRATSAERGTLYSYPGERDRDPGKRDDGTLIIGGT